MQQRRLGYCCRQLWCAVVTDGSRVAGVKLESMNDSDRPIDLCASSTTGLKRSVKLPRVACALAVFIVLQGIGLSGRYLFSAGESESSVFGVLYFDFGWDEGLAQRIDDGGTLLCLLASAVLCALMCIEKPSDQQAGALRRWGVAATGCCAFLWMLAIPLAEMVRGEAYSRLALGEHAVRFILPMAGVLVWWRLRATQPDGSAGGSIGRWRTVFVTAAAATFVVHGYKAIQVYPPFVDLVLLTQSRFGLNWFDQSTVESLLVGIGVMDISLGLLLLATGWRCFAFYMAFWGLVTACSRMTAFGFDAWPETLIRSANWGLPLAIAMLGDYRRARPAESNESVEDSVAASASASI